MSIKMKGRVHRFEAAGCPRLRPLGVRRAQEIQ